MEGLFLTIFWRSLVSVSNPKVNATTMSSTDSALVHLKILKINSISPKQKTFG